MGSPESEYTVRKFPYTLKKANAMTGFTQGIYLSTSSSPATVAHYDDDDVPIRQHWNPS
jgi:hypothetical protein